MFVVRQHSISYAQCDLLISPSIRLSNASMSPKRFNVLENHLHGKRSWQNSDGSPSMGASNEWGG